MGLFQQLCSCRLVYCRVWQLANVCAASLARLAACRGKSLSPESAAKEAQQQQQQQQTVKKRLGLRPRGPQAPPAYIGPMLGKKVTRDQMTLQMLEKILFV